MAVSARKFTSEMGTVTGSGCLVLMVQGASYTQSLLKNVSPGEFSVSRPPRLRCGYGRYSRKSQRKYEKKFPCGYVRNPVDKIRFLCRCVIHIYG